MSQKSKLKLPEPRYHLSFSSFHHYSSPPLSLWAHLILIPPVILFFCHPAIATATFHCLLLSIPFLTGCTSPGASYSFLFLFWNFFIEVWLTQQKLYIFNVQNSMHWEISVHRRCRRLQFDPWLGKIPSKRKLLPTPVLLLKKSHGQRSLVGCSPWGRRVGHDWAPFHHHLALYKKCLPTPVVRSKLFPFCLPHIS